MSSKFGPQHVQDNSVAERRLRPVYDWLDIGNNKKALQECDKVLKKTPNLHCAKALKALTLHRMGKENEAMAILDALAADSPTDDATLQAMTLCFRELQQLDKICKIYETAVKLDPSNEELHTHLFMSYARIFDFKAQQQTAMTLYKNKPKTPYYCWAVMSIIMQATRGEGKNDPKKRVLLLSLAERMMEKMILDGKLDAEQEVQLYIMILELQNKFEEILGILDGPLGAKLACSNPPQNKLKYLKVLNRWKEVNVLCKSILVESIDKWDIWKEYIGSVFEVIERKKSGPPNNTTSNHENNHSSLDHDLDSVDDTPEKCHEFICRIVENGADNGFLLRGPYLARFELCSKLMEHNASVGDPMDILGEPIELFIEYFRKFGHKPCCVSDLRLYLNLLDSEKKSELAQRLVKDVGISSTSVPQSEQQMQRHLCALQLSRLCGAHRNLSHDHLKALVTAFSLHYQHGYQTYGTNLLPTDLGPSDPYALLAAHVLYDLSVNDNNNCESIVAALVLLECVLKNSPSNFHCKLLCIRLYHTLGGALGAQNWYNSLDTKHLQLDSLGFVHCARLPTSGLISLCSNLYDITLKFFSSNYKDSSDHITFCYKYGSFLKLDEFMDFRERLNNSLHYTTVAVDRLVLTLLECTNLKGLYDLDISPKDNQIEWDVLRDNHDLSVYVGWDPERARGPPEDQPEVRSFFAQNVAYVKLRTHVLWCLATGVDMVKSQDGVRSKHAERLNGLLDEWERTLEEVRDKNYSPLRQDLVTLPLPSRLHVALDTPHFEVIGGCFKILSRLSMGEGSSSEVEELISTLDVRLRRFLQVLETRTRDELSIKDLIHRRETMEYVVNGTEMLSISCLACLLCKELSRTSGGKHKKSKKKMSFNNTPSADTSTAVPVPPDPAQLPPSEGAPPATAPSTTNNNSNSNNNNALSRLAQSLRHGLNILSDLVQTWYELTTVVSDLPLVLDALSIASATEGATGVRQNIINSYAFACGEVQNLLKTKLKMLNTIQ